MPTKPSKRIIDACRKEVDPKKAILTLIDSDPGLREAAINAKLVRAVDTPPERKEV